MVAATVMIIPIGGMTASAASFIIDILLFIIGVMAALLLDRFNQRVMS